MNGRPQPVYWLVAGLALVVLLVAGGIVLALVVAPPGAPPATPAQVAAYTTSAGTLVEESGRLEVQEIRPELASFAGGTVEGQQFTADARSWAGAFDVARGRLAALPHPGGLAPVAADFDRSYAGYVAAMNLFARAGAEDGAAREAALAQGEAAATQADHNFDMGAQALARLRGQEGLPADQRFRAAATPGS